MNKLALIQVIIIFCVMFICSCKKDTINNAKSPVGNWKWFATYKDIPLSDSNPLTTQNTGIQELLTFKADNSFKHSINNVVVDSWTYSYGHGTYTNLSNSTFNYDSILYYHNDIPIINGIDYYTFSSDSLEIAPYLADRWSCYSSTYGGSKWFQKSN